MKSSRGSRKGKGKGKAQATPESIEAAGAANRRHFLQILGAGTVGAAGLDAAFIAQAFGMSSTMQALSHAEAIEVVGTAASRSLHPEQVPQLESALNAIGLQRVNALASVYKSTGASGKTITIIPFHPTSKTAEMVGALSISDGSAPSSVSVKLSGTKVVSFTTHDVLMGKVVEKTITPGQLTSQGITPFVERNLPREHVVTDVSVNDSASLAESTFRKMLASEQKNGQYSAEQVQGFLTNLPSIRLLAQLQYTRHKGLTMSPGNACCSCCSCCWGCCSCTSAVSSSYLSDRYRSRSARRALNA
jgi:hypothetical protein